MNKTGFKKTSALILGIILVSSTLTINHAEATESSIPSWIKNTAKFWAEGKISDQEYLDAIQWLIDNNILKSSTTNQIQDNGDFYAVYSPVSVPERQEERKDLQRVEALERIAKGANSAFKLPYDIPVILSECGTPNAYYDLKEKELVFCYELLESYYKMFQNQGYDNLESIEKMVQVFAFVVIHELGHALIDVYDLPITGMEEDAVDQLSS